MDSTVITEEGIDRLAEYKGVGEAVAELTKKYKYIFNDFVLLLFTYNHCRAMGGHVLFQDALSDRLGIIKPSKADIAIFLEKYPFRFTPGVVELISLLHQRGKVVYLVSGGFRQVRQTMPLHLTILSILHLQDDRACCKQALYTFPSHICK